MGKVCREVLMGSIIVLTNKPRKMKPLNPHSFVTLPPDNPGISSPASSSAFFAANVPTIEVDLQAQG
jgi:hypothetical protein